MKAQIGFKSRRTRNALEPHAHAHRNHFYCSHQYESVRTFFSHSWWFDVQLTTVKFKNQNYVTLVRFWILLNLHNRNAFGLFSFGQFCYIILLVFPEIRSQRLSVQSWLYFSFNSDPGSLNNFNSNPFKAFSVFFPWSLIRQLLQRSGRLLPSSAEALTLDFYIHGPTGRKQ